MAVITAHSRKVLPDAVQDLKEQSGTSQPRVVMFFASSMYDPGEVSQQMQAAFPEARVAGCSTAGEIAGSEMTRDSISAVFLDGEIVGQVACAAVESLSPRLQVGDAFSVLEEQLHAPVSSLDLEKFAGVVLVDGLSGCEEALMEKIGDRTDILFVGGSAGDDLKFQSTHVMVGAKAYSNAAVLLLLELKRGFDILKTQSFRPTGKKLVATKVDEGRRFVAEFNHKPALEAYAQALGLSPKEAPEEFLEHPLGLMVKGDPFVRSPQRPLEDGIAFYCHIKQGMELEVLEATDIVAQTRQAIEARKATRVPIAGIIEFQCILRVLQLRAKNQCGDYGSIFTGIPTAGFSTYGEAYLGHINQTSTMLVFH
jgi:hypothetical protein